MAEQLWSSRNSSCCLADKENPHRWGILSRPWLKHRSNSVPMESLDTLRSRIRSEQPVLLRDQTCSNRSSYTVSANFLDVSKVTSSGMLLEHLPHDLPCSDYKRARYTRLTSDPGSSIITEPQPLQTKQNSLLFPGLLLSMSRYINRILTAREEPESVEMAKAGRKFLSFKSTSCVSFRSMPNLAEFKSLFWLQCNCSCEI